MRYCHFTVSVMIKFPNVILNRPLSSGKWVYFLCLDIDRDATPRNQLVRDESILEERKCRLSWKYVRRYPIWKFNDTPRFTCQNHGRVHFNSIRINLDLQSFTFFQSKLMTCVFPSNRLRRSNHRFPIRSGPSADLILSTVCCPFSPESSAILKGGAVFSSAI